VIDERANDAQRSALETIISGEACVPLSNHFSVFMHGLIRDSVSADRTRGEPRGENSHGRHSGCRKECWQADH
jgi:hypothetical protein